MGTRGRITRAPVVRRALQDEVYDAVMHMLLSGEVAPGAPLGIDALAARLGVSPTPVREALVRLEATSLVERSAMRGYRVVPPMDAQQVAELFELRTLVEVAAARKAFDRREVVATALERVRARQADLAADLAGDLTADPTGPPEARSTERAAQLRRYVEVDWNFHRVIAHACHNRYLEEAIERFATNPLRLHQLSSRRIWDHAATLAEHEQIERAFAAGTVDDVEAAVRHHLRQVRDRSTPALTEDRQPRP